MGITKKIEPNFHDYFRVKKLCKEFMRERREVGEKLNI